MGQSLYPIGLLEVSKFLKLVDMGVFGVLNELYSMVDIYEFLDVYNECVFLLYGDFECNYTFEDDRVIFAKDRAWRLVDEGKRALDVIGFDTLMDFYVKDSEDVTDYVEMPTGDGEVFFVYERETFLRDLLALTDMASELENLGRSEDIFEI